MLFILPSVVFGDWLSPPFAFLGGNVVHLFFQFAALRDILMKRLILPALMTLALSVGSSARAMMVTVDNLQLGAGAGGIMAPSGTPVGSGDITFIGVAASGGYTLDLVLKATPGPGGSAAQTAAGIGVSPGGGGLLDPGQEVTFSLVSATVTAGPLPFVVFDGYTDFEPDNPALASFVPALPGPAPVVKITNVGATSFGVALASLKFTAVPEPSAFMYGGMVAAVAGLGYRGRRWFGANEEAEASEG
jgi:hypothetical protein